MADAESGSHPIVVERRHEGSSLHGGKSKMSCRLPENKTPQKLKAPCKRVLAAWLFLFLYFLTVAGGAEALLLCHDSYGNMMIETPESADCDGAPAVDLPTCLPSILSASASCVSSENPCGPCTDTPMFVNGLLFSCTEELLLQHQAHLQVFPDQASAPTQEPTTPTASETAPTESVTLSSLRSTILLI